MNGEVTLPTNECQKTVATENTDGTVEAASPDINSATAKNAEERGDYPGVGIIAASEQWKNDPVEAYLRWLRSRDESLPAELPESDRLAKIGFLSEMEHLIRSEPHKINAKDPRLKKSERAKLQARQRDFFRDEALNIISWAVASSDADKTPFDWAVVSKMFYELEKTFDFFFYDTGVGQMGGDSQADIQAKVDALLATRQKALATTLWKLDSGLATRYADVLRDITMPLGLSDIEKRGPFLRKVERLEGRKPAAQNILPANIRRIVKGEVGPLAEALKAQGDTFKKAILMTTPAHKLKWWQNLRNCYERQPDLMENKKWLAVAHIVVSGAILESNKPRPADRQIDYLTPRMLGQLISKLNAPGASRSMIEAELAENLRSRVCKEERKLDAQSA